MKGEGKLGEFTLAYDFNALCTAEQITGPIGKAMQSLEDGNLTNLRALVWAGLQKHHSGTTVIQAGEILQAHGFEETSEILGKAIESAFEGLDSTGEAKAPKG